jgi:hypothetical protein
MAHMTSTSSETMHYIYPGLVMWDFVMDKSGAGAGFLSEIFGFPCTIYIPSASAQ